MFTALKYFFSIVTSSTYDQFANMTYRAPKCSKNRSVRGKKIN